MSLRKRVTLALLAFLILSVVFAPLSTQAQALVTARVDRESLTTDDSLVLTVTVDANQGTPSQPVLPHLDGFSIKGSDASTQIQMINGTTSVQIVSRYRLQPTRAGNLVIDPIVVSIAGQTYGSEPLVISVEQGTGQPVTPPQGGAGVAGGPTAQARPFDPFSVDPFAMDPWELLDQMSQGLWGGASPFSQLGPSNSSSGASGLPFAVPTTPSQGLEAIEPPKELSGQDFYAEALVDISAPYLGQQVVYIVRFYQALETMGSISYGTPSFTGFWSSAEPEQSQGITEAAGRTYRITELRTTLFPQVTGEITIDPASIGVTGGFFSRGVSLQTQPVTVDVQSLPPGAPTSFAGAVGQFDIQAATDKTEVSLNDSVTLRVAISGQGNIDALPEPQLQVGSEWRAFNWTSQADHASFEDGMLGGVHVFERILVPTTATATGHLGPAGGLGELTLPAIEYSYFDPEAETYKIISTNPIVVSVADAGNVSGSDHDPSQAGSIGTGVATNATDRLAVNPSLLLNAQKPASSGRLAAGSPLTGKPGYWLLWLAPLALIAGHFGWQRMRTSQEGSDTGRRRRRAAQSAYRLLQDGERHGVAQEESASQAVVSYLSARLNTPIAGMTQSQLAAVMRNKGAGTDLIARTQSLLIRCEEGRFSPGNLDADGANGTDGDLLDQARQLIADLEEAL